MDVEIDNNIDKTLHKFKSREFLYSQKHQK